MSRLGSPAEYFGGSRLECPLSSCLLWTGLNRSHRQNEPTRIGEGTGVFLSALLPLEVDAFLTPDVSRKKVSGEAMLPDSGLVTLLLRHRLHPNLRRPVPMRSGHQTCQDGSGCRYTWPDYISPMEWAQFFTSTRRFLTKPT